MKKRKQKRSTGRFRIDSFEDKRFGFSDIENPAVSSADRFSSDREARNITSRTCGIPRFQRDSIALSRCRWCTRILQLPSNTYNSLNQQCSFISCSRISEKTRLEVKKMKLEVLSYIYIYIYIHIYVYKLDLSNYHHAALSGKRCLKATKYVSRHINPCTDEQDKFFALL